MDSWVAIPLGAAALVGLGYVGAAIDNVLYARRQLAAHRRRYPALRETWDASEVTSIPAIDTTPREHIVYPGDPLYARVVAASRAEIGRVIGVSPDMLDLTPYRLTDTDAADAMPPPPNIGGEGNPPYAGPNYVHEEEIAEEMKGIIHTGHEPNPE